MRELNFGDALREALDTALDRDDRVFIIGEGVPDPKAIFGTTAGLAEKYGDLRVMDMPLSENGVTGVCVGAALMGRRPVMVHQRFDFALLSIDQLVNNAAKWHYMFNGQATVPLVVRLIVGRGWGQGPQHSQSLQAMFAQIPGLKVIMPATAYDAKGMMLSAIEDNNPVVFIEHRWLHGITDDVPEGHYRVPLDEARVVRTGDTVTIAAYSYMVMEALKAADVLAEYDIPVEVIDMRSVRPIDVPAVVRSVKKTGRLIVADVGGVTCGVGAEVVASVVEAAFDSLTVAPVRIGNPDYPLPTSPFLADDYYPGVEQLVETVVSLLGKEEMAADLAAKCRRSQPRDVPSRDFRGPF